MSWVPANAPNRVADGLTLGRRLATVAVIGLCVAMGAASAGAQSVTSAGDGRVRVDARAVSLGQLLSEIDRQSPLSIRMDRAVADRSVTVHVDDMSAIDALRVILRAAAIDFVLAPVADGRPTRVVIGDSDAPAWSPSAVASAGDNSSGSGAAEPTSAPDPDEVGAAGHSGPTDVEAAIAPPHPAELSAPDRLTQLLSPGLRSKPAVGAPLALPFIGPDGAPYTVPNHPLTPGLVEFPFADPGGNPIVIQVPSPGSLVQLPFMGPDGRPYTVPSSPPAGAPASAPAPGVAATPQRP